LPRAADAAPRRARAGGCGGRLRSGRLAAGAARRGHRLLPVQHDRASRRLVRLGRPAAGAPRAARARDARGRVRDGGRAGTLIEPPVKLLPGERLERVEELDLVDPPAMPDALDELCKLAGVERPEEIGLNGPVVGARVSDANVGEEALRLFEVVFGRDSLTVALFLADLFPRLLEATVPHLAAFRGRQVN